VILVRVPDIFTSGRQVSRWKIVSASIAKGTTIQKGSVYTALPVIEGFFGLGWTCFPHNLAKRFIVRKMRSLQRPISG
jgi:hypothetical protein